MSLNIVGNITTSEDKGKRTTELVIAQIYNI